MFINCAEMMIVGNGGEDMCLLRRDGHVSLDEDRHDTSIPKENGETSNKSISPILFILLILTA
jgi:hypothetical protein